MSKRLKKALKIFCIIFACISAIFTCAIIFVYLYPNTRPIDDSKLKFVRHSVPDSENGYLQMIKTVGYLSDLSSKDLKYYDEIKLLEKSNKLNELTDNQAKHLINKYGNMLHDLEMAIQFKYFEAPEHTRIFQQPEQFEFNYIAIIRLSKLSVALARHDFRKNNTREGMIKLSLPLQLGHLIQNSHGPEAFFHFGIKIQNTALTAINTFLDENLISDNVLRHLLGSLPSNNRLKTDVQNAVITRYNEDKVQFQYILNSEKSSIFERQIERLFYKSNLTNKKLYNYYVTYYEWAGRPYSEKPDIIPKVLDASLKNIFNIGNMMGETIFISTPVQLYNLLDDNYLLSTRLSMLQTRIALMLYIKSNNKLPPNLDALVPAYLQEIPIDPFDGKPLRYDPEKDIVYSIGYNLKDDGGIAEKDIFAPDRPKSDKKKDLVLHLVKTR